MGVKALHIHLGQPLGGTHHVGWVDGFIGRDEYELFHVVFYRQIGHRFGAQYIGFNGFVGVLFHHGHVLISSSMK